MVTSAVFMWMSIVQHSSFLSWLIQWKRSSPNLKWNFVQHIECKLVGSINVKMSKVYLVPIALFSLCVLAFFGSNLATILEGHTIIPYISEGATYVPQSCVFSQIVNLACILLGIVIYTRFRQIEMLISRQTDLTESTDDLNRIAMWIGFVSCFGLNIVANYQLTSIPIVHYFGAFVCFFFGVIYCWLQSYITFYVFPHIGSLQMISLRFTLAVLSSYFCFVTLFTSCSVVGAFVNTEVDGNSCKYLSVSVLSEWTVALMFCFYMLSFTREFRYISLIISFDEYECC